MTCPTCGFCMVERTGRFGPFYGCSRFPSCKQKPINIKRGAGMEDRAPVPKYDPLPRKSSSPNLQNYPVNSPLGKEIRSKFTGGSVPPGSIPTTPTPTFIGSMLNPATAVDEPTRRRPLNFSSIYGSGVKRIAFAAFGKPIADEIDAKLKNPNPHLFLGTEQQQAIWQAFDAIFEPGSNPPHIVVDAGPGTAKTSSCLQWFTMTQQSGRQIEVQATTYHSLGFSICKRNIPGRVEYSRWKVHELIDEVCIGLDREVKDYRRIVGCIKKLVGACKNGLSQGSTEDIDRFIDYYNIDIPEPEANQPKWIDKIYGWVPELLSACRDQVTEVDFDDMLWLPVVNHWSLGSDGFDILITDESQDTAPIQRALAKLACPTGRQIIVGDPKQSIMAFRGASIDAMEQFADELKSTPRGVITLPLTITQRCAKSHVELATRLFGRDKLQAVPEAPDGVIRVGVSERIAIQEMEIGDMVLCRIRKPLIPIAYALLKRGIKAIVRGRDFGTDLTTWAKGLKHDGTIQGLMGSAVEYFATEKVKLLALGVKGEGRLDNLIDRHECFIELCSGMHTPAELYAKIDDLFSDDNPKNAVLLSTVHGGKGLESYRVWILKPELMPHPKATGPWQQEQELNLLWVALTRAKWDRDNPVERPGVLVFVGQLPGPVDRGKGSDTEAGDTGDTDTDYTQLVDEDPFGIDSGPGADWGDVDNLDKVISDDEVLG